MSQPPPQSSFTAAYVLVDRARHSEESNQAEAAGLFRLVPMRPGERLLDACCGYGRHLLHFARLGLQVTGVERSRSLFKEALATLEAAASRVQLECLPLQEMTYRRQFHHAVLLNNSFGFGATAEEDVRVLRVLREALTARGHLVLDLSNPNHGEPWKDTRRVLKLPDMFVEEERKYLPLYDMWVVKQAVYRGSWKGEWQMVVRRYDHAALTNLVRACGFELEHTWSNFEGALFTGSEERMILSCRAVPE
ncbi:class I SAM-dependent methyltransferase [bacterium]|nr:class I SAM-dependent methyltransferase [bacterium]